MSRIEWSKYVFFGVIGLLVILAGVMYTLEKNESQVIMEPFVETISKEKVEEFVYVYICGEIKEAKVYKVPVETRLMEVVEIAGGMTDEAAIEMVNLARKVIDGEQIYIPSKNEIKINETLGTRKVSINNGTLEELMTLAGIGEAKAKAVIDYRKKKGQFLKLEDIMLVEGIKEGMFDKIKDEIRL